jgi:hypothetical protein
LPETLKTIVVTRGKSESLVVAANRGTETNPQAIFQLENQKNDFQNLRQKTFFEHSGVLLLQGAAVQ